MMLGYGTSSRRHGALALFLFAQLIGSQWFVVGLQAEDPKPGENPDYTISPKTVVGYSGEENHSFRRDVDQGRSEATLAGAYVGLTDRHRSSKKWF